MSFEGSEKRLQIDFSLDRSSPLGLKRMSRSQLDQLMTLTKCTIISSSQTASVDAYVLSESSLFIFEDALILKTCGRTCILNGLSFLLKLTREMGMSVVRIKYSRASFLFPDEQVKIPFLSFFIVLQHFPHSSFESEVTELNKYFGHLVGASYILGNQSRGLQWHLFYATEKQDPPQRSIEMCLTGLHPQAAQRFVQTQYFVDSRTTTCETGIADLLPGATLDDFMFQPCGYSMNGLSDNGILTIHVTPEEDCSYASVEFSYLQDNAIDSHDIIMQVLRIFDPKQIHISIHSKSSQDVAFLKDFDQGLSGYVSDGTSVQYLHDQSHVAFKGMIQEPQRRWGYSNSMNSTSSCYMISEEPSFSEGYREEDAQSNASEDKSLAFLTCNDAKNEIQVLGSVDLEAYLRNLIQTKQLHHTFYVINLKVVHQLYQTWKRMFPRIEPFYAVKCNPDTVLIRFLASLGSGFDCASEEEIRLVLNNGVPSSKILFANACKHPADIRSAEKLGVHLTTFDTLCELEKIKNGSPQSKTLLRIRADDPEARCVLGNKYGAQMHCLPLLFQKAKELDVPIVGVSFHVGSGATNPEAFSSAIALARCAFDLGRQFGFDLSILDIGGGFCSGKIEHNFSEMEPIQIAVNAALDRYFPIESGVEIIAEPGRYFAETCATLACYIIGERERTSTTTQEPLRDYWITDGLYGSFNCILYDHTIPKVFPLRFHTSKETGDPHFSSTVFGPTCDGLDTVLQNIPLPKLVPGDWLFFPDMGAYTLAGASNFNGIHATDVKIFYVWADLETFDAIS